MNMAGTSVMVNAQELRSTFRHNSMDTGVALGIFCGTLLIFAKHLKLVNVLC